MRFRTFFFMSACFALLFLLGQGLVSGPDRAPDEVFPPLMDMPCYVSQLQGEQGTGLPAASALHSSRSEDAAEPDEQALPDICVSDRNGMPLSGRTWRRTVYLVCPPEGVPG